MVGLSGITVHVLVVVRDPGAKQVRFIISKDAVHQGEVEITYHFRRTQPFKITDDIGNMVILPFAGNYPG